MTRLGREKNRLGTTQSKWAETEISSLLIALDRHKVAVEARIADLIAAHERLAAGHKRLLTVTGIGDVVASVLLARLPELGTLTRVAFDMVHHIKSKTQHSQVAHVLVCVQSDSD